jgi:hypothetical protein
MPSVFLDFAHRSPRRLRRVRFAPSVFVSETSKFPSPPRRVRFNLPVSEASTTPSPLRRVRFNAPVSIVSAVSTVPPLSCLSKPVSASVLPDVSAPRLPAPPGGAPLLGGVHAPGGVPKVNASRMKLVPDDSFPSPRGRPASPLQARADRARRDEALRAVLLRP